MPFDEQEDELEGCLMFILWTVLGAVVFVAAAWMLVWR